MDDCESDEGMGEGGEAGIEKKRVSLLVEEGVPLGKGKQKEVKKGSSPRQGKKE